MSNKSRRVFGIDPGIARFGWAAVQQVRERVELVEAGCLTTPVGQPEAKRLSSIYQRLVEIMKEVQPDRVAVEKLFFSKNVSTAMTVGQARGIALLAAAEQGLDVVEYTPTAIKQAVAGYGRADKPQVQRMLKSLLHLSRTPTNDDMADAMAVAVCGLQSGSWT